VQPFPAESPRFKADVLRAETLKKILYLSQDGALEPLGFSQVYRVVEGLGRRGLPYVLLSLEKPADLEDAPRVAELDERLRQAGVTWWREPYVTGGGGKAAARNVATLLRRTLAACALDGVGLIHARGYVPAMAAHAARRTLRVPYVFDARGYWVDERADEGQWFTSPARLAAARLVERNLYSGAAATVSLTQLQADDIAGGRFGPNRERPATCITTCADFDDFKLKDASRAPAEMRERLKGQLVLGLVGSINASYQTDKMIALARRVLHRRADAHLLVLSAQKDAYRERLRDVSPAQVSIERADHRAMPGWLGLIDWGLQLLTPERPAKRASMPTKLAEFLGTGVRPVHYGCNAEVDEWVRRTGSGIVLKDLSDASIEEAARTIVTQRLDRASIERAREIAAPHFSLASGVARYEELMRRTAL
jgi:hypothetical protein